MTTHEDTPTGIPVWHGMAQWAIEAPGELDWIMCCTTTVAGHDPMAAATDLLHSHPDRDGKVFRVVLWTNPEHTGVVWRISNTSASRFNPHTGETIDLDPLPIPVAPQGNAPTDPVGDAMTGETAWRKSQEETAAGLRWAEAIRSVPTDAQGEISWRTRVLGVREQFGTWPGDVKHPSEVVEDAAPQQIPFDYEPNVIATGRILDEAVKAATAYTLAHHGSGDWTRVEECLSPVATAAAAFVAAYTMWRFNG